MTVSRYYLTTAIDYANGEPHLGHALEKIGADAICRFHRQMGHDVWFLIGMDEHGQKVNKLVWDDHTQSPMELIEAAWLEVPDFRERYELPRWPVPPERARV